MVPKSPPGDKRGFWGKNVEKKIKNLTCRDDFGKEKSKSIFGVFLIHFQKIPFFSPIYKADYWPTFDSKVCFFFSLFPI